MSNVSNENDWAVTCNRYVAYFDIMGFKDMVSRATHDEIYNMMEKINKKIQFNATWNNLNINLIQTTTYSDSIIIFSKDDSFNSLSALILTASGLHYDLFTDAIPHKGAVAFGTMTLDTKKSIFFGQPLIDACMLQDELIFYGIIIHATVEKRMQELNEKEHSLINNYLCPLKNGNAMHKIIEPMFLFLIDPKNEKQLKNHSNLFNSFKALRLNTSGHLRKYIDNTESYLNKLKKRMSQE